jgi:carbonic anhydrase
MTFPFVQDEVKTGRLSLHGLWNDIGEGSVEQFLPDTGRFQSV